jgi:hypothetical protein
MAATLLTPATLRAHVESDLSDAALQLILDASEAEIISRGGPHATATEVVVGVGSQAFLSRPAASFTTVTEVLGATSTVLAANDYRLWFGGQILERLADGTNPSATWGDRVTIVYVPASQVAQRTLVLVQLAKLAIAFSGLKTEGVGGGDHSETTLDYTAEREKLLRSLVQRKVVFA